MKYLKIIVPLFIAIALVVSVFAESKNATYEDVIEQYSADSHYSAVEQKYGTVEFGDIVVYLYKAKNGNFGYATIKCDNNSVFNKYSVCTLLNIDNSELLKEEVLVDDYNHQGLNFTCGVVVNPKSETYNYNNENINLEIVTCENITVGVFLLDRNT